MIKNIISTVLSRAELNERQAHINRDLYGFGVITIPYMKQWMGIFNSAIR